MTTRLLNVATLVQDHKAFTEPGVRWLIFNGTTNGLDASGAIVRLGRKVVIDEERFLEWVAAHASGAKAA